MIRQTERVTPEAEIVCVDCGGRCYLTSYPPEDGLWFPGDIVTYKCRDCLDRWDLVLPDEDNDLDRYMLATLEADRSLTHCFDIWSVALSGTCSWTGLGKRVPLFLP